MDELAARPALFLDRDGVLNVNRSDHVKQWQEFEFLPGVLDALRLLTELPWPIVVITNQAIINRGMITVAQVQEINQRMCQVIRDAGGRIDAVYWCPHRPDEGCNCRKPQPGMLLRAAADLNLDLSASWLIGDALSDIQAARTAGVSPILVESGRGHQQLALLAEAGFIDPTGEGEGDSRLQVFPDLASAARWLIARNGSKTSRGPNG